MLNVQNKNSSYFVEWIPNNVKSSVRRCARVKAHTQRTVVHHLHVLHAQQHRAASQIIVCSAREASQYCDLSACRAFADQLQSIRALSIAVRSCTVWRR